ncbi:MAG: hypothetical protein ACK4NR_03930 [Micavibrio sp.]
MRKTSYSGTGIPAYDLVRTCTERISIGLNQLTTQIKTSGFSELAESYLGIKAETHDEAF